MERERETSQSVKVWYGDLPRVAVRSLSEGDKRIIRSLRLRYTCGSALLWLVTPFLFLFGLVSLVGIGERPLIFMPLAIAFFTGIGLVVTLARRWHRIQRRLGEDLKTGFVNQYQKDTSFMEVLPSSNRLWRMDGVLVPKHYDEIAQQETAATPDAARMPLPLFQTNPADGLRLATGEERSLTDLETAELLRYARSEWLRPLAPAILLTLWFWTLVIICICEGRLPPAWPGFLFLGVLAIGTEAMFIGSVRKASQMRQDAREGRVAREPVNMLDALRTVSQDVPGVQEILPHSRVLWTVNGAPADWRRVKEWTR